MRGPFLWVVALAGCYSPVVASGVPCADDGTAARCPANQVCVLRGTVELCLPPGSIDAIDAPLGDAPGDASADAHLDGPSTDAAPPAGWWSPSWPHRHVIDITAGANGAPAGYSVSIVLDHASLVAGGRSLASGNDVRIVRDSGTLEVDRVLDTGATWNTSSTRIWFSTASSLAPNATARYWVYYGNSAAATPPQNAMSVFLFADGFEGSVAAWTFNTGVGVSTTRAHRGTRSIATPPVIQDSRDAFLGSIDETNIAFDVWWNIDDLANADMAQYVRSNATSTWMTNLQPPMGGGASTWDIARVLNDNYSEIISPPSGATTPPADTWFRVTVYAYASTMAIDIAGVRYVPAAGFADIGSTSSGSIGFGTWNSSAQVWFDDATLRRFVLPEPSIALGAQQTWP